MAQGIADFTGGVLLFVVDVGSHAANNPTLPGDHSPKTLSPEEASQYNVVHKVERGIDYFVETDGGVIVGDAIESYAEPFVNTVEGIAEGDLTKVGCNFLPVALELAPGVVGKFDAPGTGTVLRNIDFSFGSKVDLDIDFIDGLLNLSAKADIGYYDGNTAYFEITAILKDDNATNDILGDFTKRAEKIAKDAGLENVEIKFNLVTGQKPASPQAAMKYGYYYSEEYHDLFGRDSTWSKTLENED